MAEYAAQCNGSILWLQVYLATLRGNSLLMSILLLFIPSKCNEANLHRAAYSVYGSALKSWACAVQSTSLSVADFALTNADFCKGF